MFVEAHFQYIAYKSVVRAQVEYCLSVWDPHPGVENTGSYKIERIQHSAWADTTTHLASQTCLKTWDGVPQSNAGLTVGSRSSLRSHGGSSLLTLTGFCILSCPGHVGSIRRVKLPCPLSVYPFSQEHYLVEEFTCFRL